MTSIFQAAADLTAALTSRPSNMRALAKVALARGADRYAENDLDGAIREFQRAVALDPSPDTAVQAFGMIASAYLDQGDTQEAIATYKKSIAIVPSKADPHVDLGNIYFSLGRHQEAKHEYQAALRINPTDSTTVLSVGHAALAAGDLKEAEASFRRVISTNPRDHGGHHALGQVLAKLGEPKAAITAFKRALEIQHDFNEARVDLGIAYAALGEMDAAQFQLDVLRSRNAGLATLLDEHLVTVTRPKFAAAYSDGGFITSAADHTPVASLDPLLASTNAAQTFEMKFLFSKEMDMGSVQDISKWSIYRAPPSSPGGGYNWGVPVDATEVEVSPMPVSVIYDRESLTATVIFVVQQNDGANGTIDPQHLTFRFRGVDAYSNAMDDSADDFSGISLIG